MLTEYIREALNRAHYEIITDEEPFYGEVPELGGVWATGRTLEECRSRLKSLRIGCCSALPNGYPSRRCLQSACAAEDVHEPRC